MPTVPISMRKLKEIIRVKYNAGLSHRQIARSEPPLESVRYFRILLRRRDALVQTAPEKKWSLVSGTVHWQPEFPDKILSWKTGAVQSKRTTNINTAMVSCLPLEYLFEI